MCGFVNLHNHTNRGSFDSVMTHDKFVSRIKELGQTHVVQTDHGTLSSMIGLAEKTQKAGLKYIPGCEFYVTGSMDAIRGKDPFGRTYYHLLAIAKNNQGLKNLQILIGLSGKRDRYYYKPRITLRDLLDHKEGLIITSGCLASMTSTSVLFENSWIFKSDEQKRAERQKYFLSGLGCDDHLFEDLPITTVEKDFRGSFSTEANLSFFQTHFKDDFYLELQDCGAEEQKVVNEAMIHYSKKMGIPLIVTSDAHYARPEDAPTRKAMLLIKHGAVRSQKDEAEEGSSAKDFYDGGILHLKGSQELIPLFGEEPLRNTTDLAAKCDVQIKHGVNHFPLPVKEKRTLEALCWEALRAKGFDGASLSRYEERLREELQTINEMGFAPYFITLSEIMKETEEKLGILWGNGRGSAAGSLVGWLLKIHRVDPLKWNLSFSRFLNKARVSLPDVDSDLNSDQRQELIRYLIESFGRERIAQVITFSNLKPRGLARDVGRLIGNPDLGIEVANLIPPPIHGKEPTVQESIDSVPALREQKYAEVVARMLDLENLTRQEGIHAAGIVITPAPLAEVSPYKMQWNKELGEEIACLQLAGDELETAGLIKYDFLGLRNLEILKKCLGWIGKKLEDIPEEDPVVFEMFRTTDDMGGIFQMEGSAGILRLSKAINPQNIEDLALISALYRPGPLGSGMDKAIIERRENGWVPRTEFDKLLAATQGTIVYQEQMMEVAKVLAGFSDSDADSLRRAIGKEGEIF